MRTNDTSHETRVAQQHLVELLCNENTSDVQLHCRTLSPIIVHHFMQSFHEKEEEGRALDLALGVETSLAEKIKEMLL